MRKVFYPYQLHDLTDGSKDIHAMITKDGNQAGRTPNGRELNEGSVVVHQRLEVLGAFRDHPVELARENSGISGDNLLTLM
jgi:hypothetical protein